MKPSIKKYLTECASKGGKARAAKLSPERRIEIAKMGARKRELRRKQEGEL